MLCKLCSNALVDWLQGGAATVGARGAVAKDTVSIVAAGSCDDDDATSYTSDNIRSNRKKGERRKRAQSKRKRDSDSDDAVNCVVVEVIAEVTVATVDSQSSPCKVI